MFEEVATTEEGDLIINVGPQHPSTHGVLHLIITLNGKPSGRSSRISAISIVPLKRCVRALPTGNSFM